MRKHLFHTHKYILFLLTTLLAIWAAASFSPKGSPYAHAAESQENASYAPPSDVGKYGMLPIYGRDVKDGVYPVEVESSSSMFRIVAAELTVSEGQMEAVITLSGTGYLKLFLGTKEEAAAAGDASFIEFQEDADGRYTYRFPVEALNKGFPCAAFSRRRERWYDRTILFDASSLPADALLVELPDYDAIEAAMRAWTKAKAKDNSDGSSSDTAFASLDQSEDSASLGQNDTPASLDQNEDSASLGQNADPVSIDRADGEYAIEVSLTGGSGKSGIVSPTLLIVQDHKAYARIQWSSSNYDYMLVGGKKYLNQSPEGYSSVFEIPITAMDTEMPVIADTTAMGVPHEVPYHLTFYSDSIGSKSQMPQEAAKRVVAMALLIIVGGGILNYFLKQKHSR